MSETPAELRRAHRAQMAVLEDRLIAMGGSVLEMLDEAMIALADADLSRAEAVIRTDDRLDEESRRLQDTILRTLALQAPVASELRLVAAFFHVNLHLERMGDLCVNVAKAARSPRPAQEDAQVRSQVAEMATHARRVIETALDCFARRDVALARTLPALDDPLDSLNRSIFRRTAQLAADEASLDWALRLVLVARHLERMADHAVDIGEQAVFAVTGDLERLG